MAYDRIEVREAFKNINRENNELGAISHESNSENWSQS